MFQLRFFPAGKHMCDGKEESHCVAAEIQAAIAGFHRFRRQFKKMLHGQVHRRKILFDPAHQGTVVIEQDRRKEIRDPVKVSVPVMQIEYGFPELVHPAQLLFPAFGIRDRIGAVAQQRGESGPLQQIRFRGVARPDQFHFRIPFFCTFLQRFEIIKIVVAEHLEFLLDDFGGKGPLAGDPDHRTFLFQNFQGLVRGHQRHMILLRYLFIGRDMTGKLFPPDLLIQVIRNGLRFVYQLHVHF